VAWARGGGNAGKAHAAAVTDADEVARLVGEVLGDDLLGAYLHGSAVLGGLRPHSDIDVLAVLGRHTTPEERREIVERLLKISGARARRGAARPVELTMVVRAEVQPWRYPPELEFMYGEWLRDDYEAGVIPSPTLSSDLAPLITMVLQAERPLLGPPPAELLEPVPASDLRRAITEGVPGLLDEIDTDTRNVLLTLVRIWATVVTGRVMSKDAAADWALPRLPDDHRPALARARAIYLGEEDDRWAGMAAEVRALAEHVVAAIDLSSAE
jgi:predicted nucleotidyltransferase